MVFDAFSRAWIRLERFNRLIHAEGGVHWGIDDPGELERDLPLRCVSAVSSFAIRGTERPHPPYRTIVRGFAALASLDRAYRLLRCRW